MVKKLLVALVVVLGLQFGVTGLFVFSASASTSNILLAQAKPPASPPANPGTPSTPPSDGSLDSTSFMFDLNAITHPAIKGSTRQSWIREGLNYFFARAISVMATVIGSLSVLMLSVGGFMMLASAGDETTYEKGKNYATYSLIGLGFTLLAYVLVSLVQLLITSIYA